MNNSSSKVLCRQRLRSNRNNLLGRNMWLYSTMILSQSGQSTLGFSSVKHPSDFTVFSACGDVHVRLNIKIYFYFHLFEQFMFKQLVHLYYFIIKIVQISKSIRFFFLLFFGFLGKFKLLDIFFIQNVFVTACFK